MSKFIQNFIQIQVEEPFVPSLVILEYQTFQLQAWIKARLVRLWLMDSKAVYAKNKIKWIKNAEIEQLNLQIKQFLPQLNQMFQGWDKFMSKITEREELDLKSKGKIISNDANKF